MLKALLFGLVAALAALLQDPADVTARFTRAVELQRSGAFEEAEREYRALIERVPGYPEAHANLGAVLMRLGRYEEAVAAYDSALRLNPGLTPVLLNLGIAHYRQGEFEKAVAALRRFLEKAPDHGQALQLIGLSLIELDRAAEAAGFLTRTLAAAPKDHAALYALGLCYVRLGKPEVRPIIERLRATTGGEAAARFLTGQLHLASSELEQAATELEHAARFDSNLARLHYALGLTYMKLGRSREALVELEAELARAPRDFGTLYSLAHLHEQAGNLAQARALLERALALDPASTDTRKLLAKVSARQTAGENGRENSFAGSGACVPCHPAQSERQLTSNMARAAFRPEEHPLFPRFKNQAARVMGLRILFLWEKGPFQISISDEKRQVDVPVQWALGAGVHGVTFFSRLGRGKYLENLLSYYPKSGALDFTPGQGEVKFQTLQEAAGTINHRPEAYRCLSCHTTGTRDRPEAEDIEVGELGVRCEACHGPGKLHLEVVRAQKWDDLRRTIENPGRYTARQVLEQCGTCHREPPADPVRINWQDPANARFQPIGLSQSRCFLESNGALSCLTCHDAHANVRQDSGFYAQVCARCHTSARSSPAAVCRAPAAGSCVGCHMPRVEAMRHMEFSNHWIGIYSGAAKLVPVSRRRP